MKTIFTAFSILILTAYASVSQTWEWQYPLPQGNWLHDVHSFSPDTAWAVGNYGTIARTNNGGINWITTSRVADITADFNRIHFWNSLNGIITSDSGIVIRTTNRGLTWAAADIKDIVESIYFINNNIGFIGSYEKIYKTTNAGSSWNVISEIPAMRIKDLMCFDENNIIAAGWSGSGPDVGNVYKTTNGGANWVSSGETNILFSNYYSMHFTDAMTGFVGGGRSNGLPLLFKTTNAGASWVSINAGNANTIRFLSFSNSNTGWISTLGGIYKTTNSGESWHNEYIVNGNTSPAYHEGFSVSFSGESGYAIQFMDIIGRNTSAGSWNSYAQFTAGGTMCSRINFIDINKGYVLEGLALRKTIDGGDNWDIIAEPVNDYQFNSSDNGWFIIGNIQLMKVSEGGSKWLGVDVPGFDFYYSLSFRDENTGYVMGKNSGNTIAAFTTNAGQSWSISPIPNNNFIIDVLAVEPNIAYTQIGAQLYKTTNSGNTWFEIIVPGYHDLGQLQFLDTNIGFISARSNSQNMAEILKTTDGGQTFNPLNISKYEQSSINSYHFLNENSGFAAINNFGLSGWSYIIKTTDGGVTWESNPSISMGVVNSVHIFDENTAWLAGNYSNILKTTNAGLSEMSFSMTGTVRYEDNNELATSGYVKAVKHNSTGGDIIVLDSVPIQSNGTYFFPNLPQDTLDLMAFDDDSDMSSSFVPTYYPSAIEWQNAQQLFPVNNMTNIDIGVFRITETAAAFRNISGGVFLNTIEAGLSGLKDAIVYAKVGNTFRGYSVSGFTGAYSIDSLLPGDYELICNRMGYPTRTRNEVLGSIDLTGINFIFSGGLIGINQETGLPDKFSLSQNYPNPFNPVTVFKFGLAKNSYTKLKIYDLLGREVASLINAELITGTYSVKWDANSYPSGVYFYRLEAGDFTATKKMVLIK